MGNDHNLADSSIEALIRAAGGRVTFARARILKILQSHSGPEFRTHAEIAELLESEEYPRIDNVTLYRVLDWATETGLINKTVDSRGTFRFSGITSDIQHASHLHFRCTKCCDVFCLDTPPPPPPTLPKGFHLSGMVMDIRGECPGCSGNAR